VASNRIVITDDDLRQMGATWTAQGRPPATADQWAALIEARVREEILSREAVSLGLDKNDTIVKRRMAQKMELVVQELAKVTDPTPAELKAWFAANPERFAQPSRASFKLLDFSSERRGGRARADAESARAKLAATGRDAAVAAELSDRPVPTDGHVDRTPEQVARELGRDFAASLFALKPIAAWQGPIESSRGWHLVWLDSLEARHIPSFEEAEPEAKAAWVEERSAEARRKVYAAMRARYEVVVPAPPKTAPDR
jgi:peptidyl-prolyl cis-trans isomerase C